jgi:hypothetical protein
MYQKYRDRAAFLFVYIQEAHPSDGWQLPENIEDDVVLPEPRDWKTRSSVARQSCERLQLSMPVVVDSMDNTVDNLYAAWPERMFVIDSEGRIAYAGAQGPWGFKPNEAERVLAKLLRTR